MKKYALTILLSTLIGLFILAENTLAASEVVIVTSFPKELFEGYKKAFEAKYPEITVVVKSKKTSEAVPANIGLIKGGPNPENAKKFIHFLLSEAGQLLLFDPQISRLPVIPELYTKAPKGFPNPFKMEASSSTFDVDLSEKRYGLMNSLFDQVVTFRLKELKGAWEAIYKTEAAIQKRKSRGKDVSKAAELLAEARTLVSTVPISEEKANDATFNQNFKEEATDVQAKLSAIP